MVSEATVVVVCTGSAGNRETTDYPPAKPSQFLGRRVRAPPAGSQPSVGSRSPSFSGGQIPESPPWLKRNTCWLSTTLWYSFVQKGAVGEQACSKLAPPSMLTPVGPGQISASGGRKFFPFLVIFWKGHVATHVGDGRMSRGRFWGKSTPPASRGVD